MIEWVPRSTDNGWSDVRSRPSGGQAILVGEPGDRAVQVPLLTEPWLSASARRGGEQVGAFLRRFVFVLFIFFGMIRGAVEMARQHWWVWAGALVLLVLLAYRVGRLRRWSHDPGASLVLTPDTIAADSLVVPWHQVERVVQFHLPALTQAGVTRNVLALEVRDFVAVGGLSPVRAGLANLTRRNLVLLGESSELRRPEQLAAALRYLVDEPAGRALLGTQEGCRLVDEGPTWAHPRHP